MNGKDIEAIQYALQHYQPQKEELAFKERMLHLLKKGAISFSRSHLEAHFTASSWILDLSTPSVLLLHHRKLDRWLQPGGHADENPQLAQVAAKEALEETGLALKIPALEAIFDLDIHTIPAHKDIPAHEHFDVRYLFLCSTQEAVMRNKESKDLAWIPLQDVATVAGHEPSILRMVRKSQAIIDAHHPDL
jgi:8-oxo-dGTP pyrophosphatase MutT (NUDIX family)